MPCDPLLIQDHLANNEAQDAFAVRRRGRHRMPHLRQVLAQSLQRCTIISAQDQRLFTPPAIVLLLDRLDRTQLLLPSPFQRTGHQPVLGLDRIVLALGSLGLIPGALAPQPPLPLELPRLPVQLPKRRQRNGDLVGRQRFQQDRARRGHRLARARTSWQSGAPVWSRSARQQ